MKMKINDKKLFDILDELGEEYKDLLVKKAIEFNNGFDLDSINVSDIIRLDSEIKSLLYQNRIIKKRIKMYNMLSIIGLLYSLMGIIVLTSFAFEKYFHDSPITLIGFIMVIFGVFVSIMAIASKLLIDKNGFVYNQSTIKIDIVNKWNELEGLIYQLTPNSDNMSFASMIDYLYDVNMISKQEIETIEKLKNIRNKSVHDGSKETKKTKDIENVLLDSSKLIKRLKKYV